MLNAILIASLKRFKLISLIIEMLNVACEMSLVIIIIDSNQLDDLFHHANFR